MNHIWCSTLAVGCAMVLAACGGSDSSSVATSTGAMSIAAGTTYTMPADTTVEVPSGATVSAPNGTAVTINGNDNTVQTQVGAVVSVPATATGPANNAVTTGSASGADTTTPAITVTVLAGSATTNLTPTDGTGTSAVFWGGGHLAAQSSGDLIVSDRGALRRVTPAGVVTTIASVNPYDWEGIAVDASGNVYGSGNQVVASETFGASIGEWMNADSIQGLFTNWETGSVNVGFGGLARDAAGNLYLADAGSNRIIKFSSNGGWTVLAGSGTAGAVDGTGGAATLTLNPTSDLAIDSEGNLYLNTGGSIRKITPDGTVTTLFSDLTSATDALALDQAGNFYIVDAGNIVRVDNTGNVTSFPFLSTTDFVTSMTTDANGNLYLGTRGLGAQIFKITF
jgi:sugar lactone lactonase YvrE